MRTAQLVRQKTILAALLVCVAPLRAQNKIQLAAPIPVQIAVAHRIFLSNAIDADYTSSARDYNALYMALKSWGKYQLSATPSDADLIFEMLYITMPSGCSMMHGEGSCSSTMTLTIHILDRATRTILWSISESPGGGGFKEATKEQSSAASANAIIEDLKVLSAPGATAGAEKTYLTTPSKKP